MAFASYEILGFEYIPIEYITILTIQPFHSYTLAHCRPIHLISIEFQNIDNNLGSPPKNLFLSFQLL
jgi:hypothetical protein